MEIRKAVCARSPTDVPSNVTPEFLSNLRESISSYLKSQNGYEPPSEVEVEEPVHVKDEIGENKDFVIKRSKLNLYIDPNDLELRRSLRVPRKRKKFVIKHIPRVRAQSKTVEPTQTPNEEGQELDCKKVETGKKKKLQKQQLQYSIPPRATQVKCPTCKTIFKGGIRTRKFSNHLKTCLESRSELIENGECSLFCSICESMQTFEVTDHDTLTRLFLEHVVLCRDHDKPHLWRHHIMKCNLCEDAEYLSYPEFKTHILENHFYKFGCTHCLRRFKTPSTEHWETEHRELMDSIPETGRYNEDDPKIPEVPWFCPCKQSFADEESRDLHEKTCNAKTRGRIQGRGLKCSFCCIACRCPEELRMHWVVTHKVDDYKYKVRCKECDITFNTKFQLDCHKRIDHNLNPMKCKQDGCNFQTFFYRVFWQHMRSSHGADATKSQKIIQEDPVQCPNCDKVYPTRKKLWMHDRKVHQRKEEIKCKECGLSLSARSAWKSHMISIHKIDPDSNSNNEKFVCPEPNCGKSLNSFGDLEKHQKTKHSKLSKLDCCLNCGRRFWLPLALRKHTILCTSLEDRTKCRRCDLRFVSRIALLEHNEEKHGLIVDLTRPWVTETGPYTCELCNGKEFKSERVLMTHIRSLHITAEREKKTACCELCGRNMFNILNLKSHLACKHGVGDFKCDQCDKVFSWKSHLSHHQKKDHSQIDRQVQQQRVKVKVASNQKRVHKVNLRTSTPKHDSKVYEDTPNEYQEFKCDLNNCDKVFNRKLDLDKHKRIGHKDDQFFMCDQCEKMYPTRTQLTRHRYHIHRLRGEPTSPKPAGRPKKRMTVKAKESLSKLFLCDQCEKKYTTKYALDRHLADVHKMELDISTAFQCDKCEKAYGSKQALSLHLTVKHPPLLAGQTSSSSLINNWEEFDTKNNDEMANYSTL